MYRHIILSSLEYWGSDFFRILIVSTLTEAAALFLLVLNVDREVSDGRTGGQIDALMNRRNETNPWSLGTSVVVEISLSKESVRVTSNGRSVNHLGIFRSIQGQVRAKGQCLLGRLEDEIGASQQRVEAKVGIRRCRTPIKTKENFAVEFD